MKRLATSLALCAAALMGCDKNTSPAPGAASPEAAPAPAPAPPPDTAPPFWKDGDAVEVSGPDAEGRFTLTWPAASDADTGVKRYRIMAGETQLAELAADTRTYVSAPVEVAASRALQVVAGDAANNWVSTGLSATLERPDVSAPTWPEGATVSATLTDGPLAAGGKAPTQQLSVTWPAAADDVAVTGYRVRVGDTQVAEVAADATTWSGVVDVAVVSVSVVAGDAAGNWSPADALTAAEIARPVEEIKIKDVLGVSGDGGLGRGGEGAIAKILGGGPDSMSDTLAVAMEGVGSEFVIGVGAGGLGFTGSGAGGGGEGYGRIHGMGKVETGGGMGTRGLGGRAHTVRGRVKASSSDPAVQSVVKRRVGALRSCYERGLREAETLAGVVKAPLVVDEKGRVSSVKASWAGGDDGVTRCIERTLRRMRLPTSAAGEHTVTVTLTPAAK